MRWNVSVAKFYNYVPLSSVFCALESREHFCSPNSRNFDDTSLTKGAFQAAHKTVFEHCSQNECHRSELKTRDQNSLKDLNVRWKSKFCKCSTGLNIIHIPFSQGSTTMIKRFFVLDFEMLLLMTHAYSGVEL